MIQAPPSVSSSQGKSEQAGHQAYFKKQCLKYVWVIYLSG